MSDSVDDTDEGAVADQAARWFVRLHDDASTGDDWLAFEAWLGAAPEHQDAYDRVEQSWVEVEDVEPLLAEPAPAAASPSAQPRRDLGGPRRDARRPTPSRRTWAFGAAALAAGLAVAVVGVNEWPGAPNETFIAPVGQTRDVVLADGTHVWLNAGSRLDVRMGRKAREVELADGEAAFDVTHDPKRPFLISTGQHEVRVIGTEFNLRQRDRDFALTVRRGVVAVRSEGAGAQPLRVAAGYRLTAHGAAPAVLTQAAPDAAFAWTQGQLVYDAAPLSTVAADLSRSLGAPVRVADATTGALRFSGVLTLDDRPAVLHRLESFAPVRVEADGAGYVIHAR